MRVLKEICLTVIRLVKRICLFPRSIANAFKEKRHWMVQKELEAERLDRIRNPSKYLGK